MCESHYRESAFQKAIQYNAVQFPIADQNIAAELGRRIRIISKATQGDSIDDLEASGEYTSNHCS